MKLSKHLVVADTQAAAELGITEHAGWVGVFTRRQATGALVNGSRVIKTKSDASGDLHPVGTCGTVLGSIGTCGLGYMYFVEWDPSRRLATCCHESKLKAAPHG